VLVAGFPAGSFGTNCYVVAPAAGEECVVVDPGQDATRGVEDIVREHRLKPVAVLLTHGHIDHVWSVAPVCGAHDVPAYVHPADRPLLTEPWRGLSPEGKQAFGGLMLTEPSDVIELTGHDTIVLAGLAITVDHAPGHTKGSVTFTAEQAVFLAGDLLFQGSIGRTDLPGGDWDEMRASLARVVLPLPDELPVLPGHGPSTTIGRERAHNPFLQEIVAAQPPVRGL
jgi:hydroxyacylglutathione hydrolase